MMLNKSVIGMVHVPALPGTPKAQLAMSEIINHSVGESLLLQKHGFDAILIENMHDVPYLKGSVGPEVIAAMTAVALAIKARVDIPVGIQILAGANKEALAVAKVAGLGFVRAEGFVFGHVADEGYHDSCAAELLRYRKNIGAENVRIFTDIKKKHASHQLTSDVNLLETAIAAQYFLSDGVIVTGNSTGKEASHIDLLSLNNKLNIPVVIGSGITAENIASFWPLADAFIIGSYLKEDGFWQNEMSPNRLRKIQRTIHKLKD